MDGTSLIPSGKKAVSILAKHLIDVIALNKVGDFVLFLGKVFVTVIAGVVGCMLISVSQIITSIRR